MSLAYLNPQDQMSFEDILAGMAANNDNQFDANNLDALFGSALGEQALQQHLAALEDGFLAAALGGHGAQHGIDFGAFVAPGAMGGDFLDAASYASSGPGSPADSVSSLESLNLQSNPFAALVIPSDRSPGLPLEPVKPFMLFPSVTGPAVSEPKAPARGPYAHPGKAQPRPTGKRPVRGPSVAWPAASTSRAPSAGVPVQLQSPVLPSGGCMPSPPMSPSGSVKDEASACVPSPTSGALGVVASGRTPSGGIRTPFDDMADEDLDDLDEDEIAGMMGKTGPRAVGADGKDKKKRKRRTTAELAPQELEVRRIKNSEAARRCRLRKTLKLRWLEARCAELEETNARMNARLADLEARVA